MEDRDINASINILKIGLTTVGIRSATLQEICPLGRLVRQRGLGGFPHERLPNP
ncbi:hypothetical protein [Anabaena sp. 90]|uniref:hypothetical protein n=1 Tax=Nostocales TaxID=1161 RepID=UPI000A007F82